ncbi:hypothetical protein BGX28_008625, partial [Mortierella sp. GBA30]
QILSVPSSLLPRNVHNMRFSFGSTIVAASTLALFSAKFQVSATLDAQERAAIELKEGSNANFCPPCLQKAMHNHFPHACRADLDADEANYRPEGSTPEEERCVCVAFRDLFWMKADCSLECHYVHNEKAMKYFLPSEQIEGCDKWIDFETGKEREVEGFAPKNEDHQPIVYPIASPPPTAEDEPEDDDDHGGYKVTVKVTTADDAKDKGSGIKPEIEAETNKTNSGADTKKDEL